MESVKDKNVLKKSVGDWHAQGLKIGVVLTMGALHAGHLSLINALLPHVDRVIVTSFVNPAQFNDQRDFHYYPRDLKRDSRLLQENGHVDLFYAPSVDQIYPAGFLTHIDVGPMGRILCGTDREGHFNGAALVVTKLLMQTQADVAAFGEKDYQQLCLMRRVTSDLDMDVTILPVPTLRHGDGLAFSSRNERLTDEERDKARLIPQLLSAMAKQMRAGEEPSKVLTQGKNRLEQNGFTVHYLDLRSAMTLEDLSELADDGRLFVAATLGGVRLIDNMSVLQASQMEVPKTRFV